MLCPSSRPLELPSRWLYMWFQDVCSMCLGLAAVAVYQSPGEASANARAGGLGHTLLVSSLALFSLSVPPLTWNGLHTLTGSLLAEKRAHALLFVFGQAWLVASLLALQRSLGIGDFRALGQVAHVAAPIAAYYALDHQLDPRQILLLPVSFVGVILLCQPTLMFFPSSESLDYMGHLYSVFLGLGAGLARAFAAVALKGVRRTSPIVSAFALSGTCAVFWTAAALAGATLTQDGVVARVLAPAPCEGAALLLACVLLGAISLFLRRRHWSEATRFQAWLGSLEASLAYGLQYLAWGHVPHWSSAAGATLVCACAVASVTFGKAGSKGTGSGGSGSSQFSVVVAAASRKVSTCTQLDMTDLNSAGFPRSPSNASRAVRTSLS